MVAAVRKILILLVVLVAILIAIGALLVFTVPSRSADVHALIAQVPASAEAFAVIPRAAAFDAKLQANPVTRSAIAKWSASHPLPSPWMIGNADLIAWRSGDQIHYLVRTDTFRAFLIRMFGSKVQINVTGEPPMDSAAASQIIALTSLLPAGDALVVQREEARGAYPPIGRPAVTSIQVNGSEIAMTSVAAGDVGRASARPDGLKPVLHFPHAAILSAAFTQPPRAINDLNRIFGGRVSSLFDAGGMVCIYNVDTRKLIPRPLGVIVLPDDPARRAIVDSFRKAEAIGIRARMAEVGGNIALAFDDSIDQYQKDAFDDAPATNQWAMRIDPQRLVPILNDLGQNVGLRIVAPRLFRSARDLQQWIGGLEQAKTIDATDSADSQWETLHVRIAAK
jgi:hypothetical protein